MVAEVALALALLAAAWSLVLLVTRRPPGRFFTVNLAWTVGALVVAAALGLLVLLVLGGPHDALHLLYGVLALAALPLTAMVAAQRPARQQPLVRAVGTIVLLILVLRLFQTAG